MGKTDLGKWMITNGGEYSADATYEQLTMVKYGNSTYITLKTVTGITPVDDKINYQLMAQGFDATALSAVQAEDTQGLCGEKGNIVTAQSLVDALADKVINTVMTKIGTAALTGGMTDLSSGLNALNSNLGYLGEIREAYLSTAITPQSGQTYTIGSLSLETGKWLLFGATLAGGDLIIDGNIISRLNGRNANTSSDISMRAFAISNGGIVNLKLVSNGFGMLHADKTYCGLTAVRIG